MSTYISPAELEPSLPDAGMLSLSAYCSPERSIVCPFYACSACISYYINSMLILVKLGKTYSQVFLESLSVK